MNDTKELKLELEMGSISLALDGIVADILDHYLGEDGWQHIDNAKTGAVALAMINVRNGTPSNSLCHLESFPQLDAFSKYTDADPRLTAFSYGMTFVEDIRKKVQLKPFMQSQSHTPGNYSGPLALCFIYTDEKDETRILIRSLHPDFEYERLFDITVDIDTLIEDDWDHAVTATEVDTDSNPKWTEPFTMGVIAALEQLTHKVKNSHE